MAPNNWDGELARVTLANNLRNEGLGTDNVQGSNTKQTGWIKAFVLLEHLCSNWDGRVDRVGDDENKCLGAVFSDPLDEALDNTGVDLKEIISGHARLA